VAPRTVEERRRVERMVVVAKCILDYDWCSYLNEGLEFDFW